MTPIDRETAIASGTVLLTAKEVVLRLGYSASKGGVRKVMAMVAAKTLPAVKLNKRVIMFHWPTVVDVLGKRRWSAGRGNR